MKCKHCQGELEPSGTVGARDRLTCVDCGHTHLLLPELTLVHDSSCCNAVRTAHKNRM